MTCYQSIQTAGAATRAPESVRRESPLRRLWRLLLTWQRRAEERHALLTMDQRMRRDIGVSNIEIAREAAKPFWRA